MVYGAGRTDKGVHAKQLFAHFDINSPINTEKIVFKLNSFLPNDISCMQIFKVDKDKHARFSASNRTYEYWITSVKDPFLLNKAYYFPHTLNVDLMNTAANLLMDYTDFSCFSKSNTDTFTNNCSITKANWEIVGNRLIFTITADRFLRNMVRAIVGTLLDIGQERIDHADLHKIITSKNRSNAGGSAPAHGLYLTEVVY